MYASAQPKQPKGCLLWSVSLSPAYIDFPFGRSEQAFTFFSPLSRLSQRLDTTSGAHSGDGEDWGDTFTCRSVQGWEIVCGFANFTGVWGLCSACVWRSYVCGLSDFTGCEVCVLSMCADHFCTGIEPQIRNLTAFRFLFLLMKVMDCLACECTHQNRFLCNFSRIYQALKVRNAANCYHSVYVCCTVGLLMEEL